VDQIGGGRGEGEWPTVAFLHPGDRVGISAADQLHRVGTGEQDFWTKQSATGHEGPVEDDWH
jgi:hypothetical protein